MALADTIFLQRLLDKIAQAGLARARQALEGKGSVQSRQLIDSLEVLNVGEVAPGLFEAKIFTSPYYAVFVHDGSGPASRDNSQPPFVWYKDPLLDPRLDAGRTPPRVNQLRHLTGEQFRTDLEAGLLILARNIRRRKANPFLSNEPGGGMFKFIDEAGRIAKKEMSAFVREQMGSAMNIKGSVSISI